MKLILRIFIVFVLVFAGYYGISHYIYRNTTKYHSVDNIPQSGDPCGGTNGNGQIVSVGSNSFVITVTHGKNNGDNQVVGVTAKTSFRTSTGSASISALKTGGKVTVAGATNSDGTFTAKIVAVCN